MSLPLSALRIRKVCAMTGECPTVVQSPSDLTTVRRKPTEQHFNVHPVAMDVV